MSEDNWAKGYLAVQTTEFESLLSEALKMLESYEDCSLGDNDEYLIDLIMKVFQCIKSKVDFFDDNKNKQRFIDICSIIMKISFDKLEKDVMGVN